jgi:hypothetical protein
VRTPLGSVLIARLREAGTIEVAGPSAAEDVRAVSTAMLGHGAEQVWQPARFRCLISDWCAGRQASGVFLGLWEFYTIVR